MTALPLAELWCCSCLLLASWELQARGCMVHRVCLSVPLGLQVPEHPAASSVPSSGQPHLDGHGNPWRSAMPREDPACQGAAALPEPENTQQLFFQCCQLSQEIPPRIEVIVPGVRSIKLNSPKFNQFDKQGYCKATAAASKSHFSSLLRDLV